MSEAPAGVFRFDYITSTGSPIFCESHCHTQYEMIAVTEGAVSVMLEGKAYALVKNQVIIIPPLHYHSVTAGEENTYHRIIAQFGRDAIPPVLREAFDERRQRAFLTTSPTVERLEEIYRREEQAFYAPLLDSLMIQLFYEVLREQALPAAAESDEFLKKVLSYIDAHLQEKITLDDLAKHTARSKSSLCHLFREKMKISPKQYILKKKLAVATKLIDEGVPQARAALAVGYENYSNFYRLCRKHQV